MTCLQANTSWHAWEAAAGGGVLLLNMEGLHAMWSSAHRVKGVPIFPTTCTVYVEAVSSVYTAAWFGVLPAVLSDLQALHDDVTANSAGIAIVQLVLIVK